MNSGNILRTENFEQREPTEWDLFEAMDRASIVMTFLDNLLCDHVGLNEEQAEQANQAFSLLFGIYQTASRRFFDITRDEND